MVGRCWSKLRRMKLSGPDFDVRVRISCGSSAAKADLASARLMPPSGHIHVGIPRQNSINGWLIIGEKRGSPQVVRPCT